MSDSFGTYTRRTFLKAACSTAIIASTGCDFGENKWEKITAQMIGALNHPERARMIGNFYIDSNPQVRDLSVTRLAEKTLTSLEVNADQLGDEELGLLDDRIRKRIQQDFADENIVVVKGYLLSETEAMLCALAAVAHAASG